MDLRSGYPFWLVKNGLVHTYPALESDQDCDVVVIGGGITGALAAYTLVQEDVDVIVVDKRDIGWGSTSASTAMLQYEIDKVAYIGQTDEIPNAYFALGYGGNGITYSMIAARMIADLYVGRRNDDAYLFRFDR